MARIAGINLPENKRADVGLTRIFGIGRSNVLSVLRQAKIEPKIKIKDLDAAQISNLTKVISEFPVEGVLKKQINENIKRLRTTGTYRGLRHGQGLPVRGQRTRSNARTNRGKRKTVGAMRKKDMAKLDSTKSSEKETNK